MLSIVDVAPLEAISSSGVVASEGRIDWSAGRKRVEVTPTTAASAKIAGSLLPAK